jgi:hypothetical protein
VCVCVDLRVSVICFFQAWYNDLHAPLHAGNSLSLILLYCIVCKLFKSGCMCECGWVKWRLMVAALWPNDIFPYWHIEAEQLRLTGSLGSCAKSTNCDVQPAVATRCGNSGEWCFLLCQHAYEQKGNLHFKLRNRVFLFVVTAFLISHVIFWPHCGVFPSFYSFPSPVSLSPLPPHPYIGIKESILN